jgi:mycothiol synthase
MTAAHEIISDDPALGEGELVTLARRCWAADGGLPLAVEPWFVRGRWSRPGTKTFTVRASPAAGAPASPSEGPSSVTVTAPTSGGLDGGAGGLLAAIAVRPGSHGPMVTGLVDPAVRGSGIGTRLLDAALAVAAGSGTPDDGFVTVETEGLSPDAEKLFESRGLRQFFAEDVMRIDLTGGLPPEPAWPAGAVVAEWTGETAERFFRVYAASFRERPGFPDPSAQEWIEETAEDDDFRPAWSLLATLPEIGDAGFVSVGENWIQQVGVVPAARRTGLGGALIRESLRRMAGAGLREGWLCVNVDNAAASLYRRIGFQGMGRRARYRLAGS